MGQRKLTWPEFRRILRSFGVSEDPSRGKGSHTYFFKQFPDGEFGYPVPQHGKDVPSVYVKGLRKRLRLTPDDGISDAKFFGCR
jgi:hypothetical protein